MSNFRLLEEQPNEGSAKIRNDLLPDYNNKRCSDRKHEWAELKTSILSKLVINDVSASKTLADFWYTVLGRLSTVNSQLIARLTNDENILGIVRNHILTGQIPYPVLKTIDYKNPKLITTHLLGLFTMARMWWPYVDNHKIKDLPTNVSTQYLHIIIIMKSIQVFLYKINNVRSKRDDVDYLRDQIKNKIGISNIENDYLKEGVTHAWAHPGRTKCKPGYRGTYGKSIRDSLYNNDGHGSIQCDISGNTIVMLFTYMYSLVRSSLNNKNGLYDKETIREHVNHLISSCITVLVADGGHNIREVITSIVLMSIVLKNIKNDMVANKGYILNLIGNSILTHTQGTKHEQSTGNIGLLMRRLFQYWWSDFIDVLYEFGQDFDILSTFNNLDINRTPIDFETAKRRVFTMLFTGGGADFINYIHLLAGLDNNRYRNNNFDKIPKLTISKLPILSGFDAAINEILRKHATEYGCDVETTTIPLAFKKSKRKSPKKTKKSKSKRKSPTKSKKSKSKRKSPKKTKKSKSNRKSPKKTKTLKELQVLAKKNGIAYSKYKTKSALKSKLTRSKISYC